MLADDFLKKDDRGFRPISSSRSTWYFALLVFAKLLRCFGIFIVHVLAKQIHVVGLLWLLRTIASAIVVPVQKPLSHGKSIRKSLLLRIAQLSFFNCLIEISWFYGITFCGPFRSILVYEQSPATVFVAATVILKVGSTPSKTRGLVALVMGYAALILMDSDSTVESDHSKSHGHHSVLNHLFYHVISWFGVSDHKGGVLLLIFTLFVKIAYDSYFRRLAVEVGGPKRLYSLTTFFSSLFLTPFAIWATFDGVHVQSYPEFALFVVMASIIIMVFDFYAESICFQHVSDPVMAAARWSPMIMFTCAFVFAFAWDSPGLQYGAEHALSGGVSFTLICFIIASFALTSSDTPRARAGHYVGLSEAGAPLYTYGEAFLQRTSRSMVFFIQETISEVLGSSDSRRIFWFLCANLAFCGVEFLYGFWTNSLGLISDGFHMLFDCSALVMGLVASVMSRWPPSKYYSYGYGRVEVLSGFINALFLIVIAFFIFLEALERLYDPPDIRTEKLMFVAVFGLIINIFGMFAFHGSHGHSHGAHGHSHNAHNHSHSAHGHSHGSHSAGHGHSRDSHGDYNANSRRAENEQNHSNNNALSSYGGSHDHSRGAASTKADHGHSHTGSHGHSHGANANMRGVFLHVLADTLGSVFVIISTFLMQLFEWKWVDPFCSLVLSLLILASVIPLLKASLATLMQNIPREWESDFDDVLDSILRIDGVISFSRPHLWQLKSDFVVGSIHIQISNGATSQLIRQNVVKILKSIGLSRITVQIEQDYFLHHVQSVCPSYYLPNRVFRGVSTEENLRQVIFGNQSYISNCDSSNSRQSLAHGRSHGGVHHEVLSDSKNHGHNK